MNLDTQNNRTLNTIYKDKGFSKILKLLGIKEKAHILTEEELHKNELIEGIKNARSEWITANMNYEYADASDMVDYYSYKIKACQIRYEYLLKKAKELGIKVDVIENKNPFSEIH
ncbi:MAG: hypothetical protein K0R31_223 [Clostridiales bacterium]|jgi:hypothetical protein|nr:hypothetical protein [Clostridiales bacterium]